MHENKAEAGFILIKIEVKKEKDSCCCLLWSSASPLQQEAKHLPLRCTCKSTGGAVRDIWRVRPVPGRFKDVV